MTTDEEAQLMELMSEIMQSPVPDFPDYMDESEGKTKHEDVSREGP